MLIATLDRRLIALDARTVKLCKGFGSAGTVDLRAGIYLPNKDYLFYTSPPIVVGDTVILGSSIADNQNIDAPSGAIRAFDVRTGRPLWASLRRTELGVGSVRSEDRDHVCAGELDGVPYLAEPRRTAERG